jgi:hypothetical protein
MAQCFVCKGSDANRDAIIELPKPAPTIDERTSRTIQSDPVPERRVKVQICEGCYGEVKRMPWDF